MIQKFLNLYGIVSIFEVVQSKEYKEYEKLKTQKNLKKFILAQ